MFDYAISLLILIIIYGLLTVSLNMVMGYIGYIHLGHVAFWGVGSYTFALLILHGTPFFPALLAGGVLAGAAGFIIGLPTLRLKSHYIAIASFGFMDILYSLTVNFSDITRGPLGIPGIPRPTIFGYTFESNGQLLLLMVGIGGLLAFVAYRLLHAPFGKILEMTRDDEIATKTLGKNTYTYKLQAFTVGAFIAGIVGGLSASYFNFISPTSFYIPQMLTILAMLMVGGIASFWGSFVGAAVITLMTEGVRFLPFSPNIVGPLRTMIFSLFIIVIMLYRPNGLMGKKLKTFQ